jgi:chromosomal replication initiator protein
MVAALSRELAERIGAKRFSVWFGSQTRLYVAPQGLRVQAANAFVCDWLRKHFADDIRSCWHEISGCSSPIAFEVDPSLVDHKAGRAACRAEPGCPNTSAKPAAAQAARKAKHDENGNIDGWRASPSLATFVVGASNEYAFHAAELTARGRQQASPVVFCGPTGVGKTHLLRAVHREYRRHHPRHAAVYLTAEQFTTAFVEAVRGTGLPSFRQKCRGAQLLLIDDLQFFAGKQRTLEELQHTIDTLVADGRKVLIASDRGLADLRFLGPETTSRLAGGLVCEIEPPEFATRLGIVRSLSREMAVALDEEVLRGVATQVAAGARELRGALHRLQAMSQAFGGPVTRELADKALAELARHSTPTVRLGDVQKVVCDVFGVEPGELRSERKGRSLDAPRMLAMWLARKYTRSAWSEIGQFFGRRSHSTVIAAHRKVERLITTQAEIGVNDRTCRVEDTIRRLETALRTA